jgi:hypothetical protein
MGEWSDAARASVAERLDLPADATIEQILAAVAYLNAVADAKGKGVVAKDKIRASVGISDSEPAGVVNAAVTTLMLRRAKALGLPAATPPKEIQVGIRAAKRAADSRREDAGGQGARRVAASTAGRVAAATSSDLTGMYARNPLVAQTQVEQRVYASAVEASGGQAPTLFRGGDLPAFTASGVDPSLLLHLPWTARHAAAAQPDRAVVLDMFENLAGSAGPVMAAEYEAHPGNKEYAERVIAWQQAGYDLEQHRSEERQVLAQAARAEEVRAALGDPENWTDEQAYDHLFGEIDRRAEQKKIEEQTAILEGRTVGHGYDLDQVRASLEERIAASGVRTPENTSKAIDFSAILAGDDE